MPGEGMEKAAKKVEVAANIAIIIVALAGVLFFIRNYKMNRAESRIEISTGTKFALKDMNWQVSEKSVALALSTTCHFCTESAGFYRELVQRCKEQHVHTVAVFPQAVNEAQSYLQNVGVTVDEIRQGSFPDLKIGGTPTLLLLDNGGVVKSVWVGKLPPAKEQEVLSKLGSQSAVKK
jgi:hypothetical protein